MKIRFFAFSIATLLLLCCSDKKLATKDVEIKKSEQTTKLTTKAIENLDYTDYALSPESEMAIANWEKYQELAIQIGYLKKADLSFFNGDKEELRKFIIQFKASTPKELLTNAIVSRTLILETTLFILNEDLNLSTKDDSAKLLSIKEVLIAFSNLNYQINKKLERDLYDQIQPE